MVKYQKLSHTIWYCQYHVVWTPKYRFRVLKDAVAAEIEASIRMFSSMQGVEIAELSIQLDHVHIILDIPPKLSISSVIGVLKGRSAIRIFQKFKQLKRKPYWGNHFWARGYCVSSIGLDADKVRRYVRYQEAIERKSEQ